MIIKEYHSGIAGTTWLPGWCGYAGEGADAPPTSIFLPVSLVLLQDIGHVFSLKSTGSLTIDVEL